MQMLAVNPTKIEQGGKGYERPLIVSFIVAWLMSLVYQVLMLHNCQIEKCTIIPGETWPFDGYKIKLIVPTFLTTYESYCGLGSSYE